MKPRRGFLRVPIPAALVDVTEKDAERFREHAQLRAAVLGAQIVKEIGEQHRTLMGVPMREYVFVMQVLPREEEQA